VETTNLLHRFQRTHQPLQTRWKASIMRSIYGVSIFLAKFDPLVPSSRAPTSWQRSISNFQPSSGTVDTVIHVS